MKEMTGESRGLRAIAPWLGLLTLCFLINYIDRGNLSIAAPLLKDELNISPWELGILFSAFFWTYTALQFVMGWVVDRFAVNLMLALGFLVWSLATMAIGLVEGFALLLMMRLMLGVGESVVFPACSKIFALHVTEEHRGFANGVVQAGLQCGPAVGTFGAGVLMARYGWRPVFIGIGLVSLLWLPAWWRWMPRGKPVLVAVSCARASLPAIFRQRAFWGACGAHFCSNYSLYVMVSWLPFYLVRERHLSLTSMAKTAAIYFLVSAAASAGTGWLSDWFIRRGYATNLVRKSAMLLGGITAAIGIGGTALAGPHTYLAGLFTGAAGAGMVGSSIFAFAQILAGPRNAGTWTGFQNGFANLAGIIAPALTGMLVGRTGGFAGALLIAAAASLSSGLLWAFAIGPLRQVAWPLEIAAEPVAAG